MASERYLVLGSGLTVMGVLVTILSFRSTPDVSFEALGIAISVVGLTALSLPEPAMGSDAEVALLRGSTLGIEPMLSEIWSRRSARPSSSAPGKGGNKAPETETNHPGAVYLPPYGPTAQVYIPIDDDGPVSLEAMRSAPTTLTHAGDRQGGILVFTAGSYLGLIPGTRGKDTPLLSELLPDQLIERRLSRILTDSTKLCSSVIASKDDDTIVVEMRNVKAWPEPESLRKVLGSFPSSLAASIVAAVFAAPVAITGEEITRKSTVARLLILSGNGKAETGRARWES